MDDNVMTSEAVVAATFLLPASSAEPLVVELPHHALRLVVVNKGSVSLLDDSWDAGGVYVLLGAAEQREHYSAYVGKAPSGLLSRVGTHVRAREGWNRALLVSHTSYGFSSAAVGWLEGRLWDVLTAAPAAELRNRVRPRDETLPPWERRELERYITPITAVLRAIGANPDTPDQGPVRKVRRPRRYTETVADLLDERLLVVGARLRPLPEAFDTPAAVLGGGRLEVDGKGFETPSAAAVHVAGRAMNGWDFWGTASGDGTLVPLSELRRRLRDGGATTASELVRAKAGERTKPAENQPDGKLPDAVELDEEGPAPSETNAQPSKGSSATEATARRAPRRIEGTLADIDAAGLFENPVIFAVYKGQRYDVARHGDNGLVFPDGTTFNSLSLAAQHVTRLPTNGWTFWKTEKGGKIVRLAVLRAVLASESGA